MLLIFWIVVQNIHIWGGDGVQTWILMSLCKDITAFLMATSFAMISMGKCYLRYSMHTKVLFSLVSTHLMLTFCLLLQKAMKVSWHLKAKILYIHLSYLVKKIMVLTERCSLTWNLHCLISKIIKTEQIF